MFGLCGFCSPRFASEREVIVRRMLGEDAAVGLSADPFACVTASGDPPLPARWAEQEGVVLAWVGHPRPANQHGESTPAIALARAFKERGASALDSIGGDFAIAVWDRSKQRGLIAVDRIGVRQLFYARIEGGLAFASNADALLRHPGVRRELSAQALFDYLYFHVVPGPQTIYRDVQRLPPGHFLEIAPDRSASPQAYWSMRFEENPRTDLSALQSQFRGLLKNAVASASEGAQCATFLSGGTDSSTVTGILAQIGARPAAFSIGFAVAGYDEMQYARIAARHFGCSHHEYYVTAADVVDAAPKIAALHDQPFGNASAIPAFFCARLARQHGYQRLLAGDGGDELFGGNERYARQHVLALYHRIPRALRAGLLEPLLLSNAHWERVPGIRKLRSYVQQAQPAMPLRYESYNLLTRLQPRNVLSEDFLASVDLDHPRALLREAHAPFAGCALINQMLGIDLRFTLADNDLPKVVRSCELAGIDVAFPLLDEAVVAFSAQLAPALKLRGTQLRWFFKRALSDFLPPEIIAKRKHGFGLPVGAWLLEHKPLFDLACAALDRLRPLGLLRPGFADELRKRLLPQHPAYYGAMVWLLMMLGLWLEIKGNAPVSLRVRDLRH